MLVKGPRRRLLDIWSAILDCAAPDASWGRAGRDGSNSISDAELLVCLLYPAFKLPALAFFGPDTIGRDVRETLQPLGEWPATPLLVTGLVEEYLGRYTAADGTPAFPSGGYLRTLEPQLEVTAEQAMLETVESFSMSITFSLSALAFVKGFTAHVGRPELVTRLRKIESALSVRLTHAMSGLRDSFTVDLFADDSPQADRLYATVNRDRAAGDALRRQVRDELRPTRAALRELQFLPHGVTKGLADESLLFQCGWAWGRVTSGGGRTGAADPAPSLYFTVAALDGIVDLLHSDQVQHSGVLQSDQQSLVGELRTLYGLTHGYWTMLASFGRGKWPLEDLPWRAPGPRQSVYATLQVASIVVHHVMRRPGLDSVVRITDTAPLSRVLQDLAVRGAITGRPLDDGAVELHDPGLLLPLPGSERHGPAAGWLASDFAPMLLKRVLQVAGLTPDLRQRDQLHACAEAVSEHLWQRRITRGAVGLWDAPQLVYDPASPSPAVPSWYMTERVVEVLVVATAAADAPPARSAALAEQANELLREAEHLLQHELLMGHANGSSVHRLLMDVEGRLTRARGMLNDRPGTAAAAALVALGALDGLDLARNQATTGG
jgi:hypothetical protein